MNHLGNGNQNHKASFLPVSIAITCDTGDGEHVEGLELLTTLAENAIRCRNYGNSMRVPQELTI